MRWFLLALVAWFAALPAHAAQSERVDTGYAVASLVTSHDVVEPGQTLTLALLTELDEGWHTYWRNPGDSGEPVSVSWSLPDGATASDIFWPIPEPVATGPIINYGFEGAPLFPIEVTLPDDVSGEVTLAADAYYLVCADICVPESAQLSLVLRVGEAVADPYWSFALAEAVDISPKPQGREAGASVVDGAVLTDIMGELPGTDLYIFPYNNSIVDHSAPQVALNAERGTRFAQAPGFGWDGGTPEAFEAVISYRTPEGLRGEVVTVVPGKSVDLGDVPPVPTAATGTGDVVIVEPPQIGTDPIVDPNRLAFLPALLFAFLGGIILNVMPCVFPVISIKALSLTRAAHSERTEARREAWAYTAGVVAMFMAFAGTVLALKAGGSLAGWGFQLQNPKIVGFLALLTFVIGLNFLGAFAFGGRLQNAGHGLTQAGGMRGAFFTGLLAVIVATPCTGPFMAGALGYTLLAPAGATLAIFLALALGFAFPFLLLAYSPALLAKLPKPGPWMETFRQILAFPLFATSIWLVWVLSAQAGSAGVALVLSAALAIAFAVWLLRRFPARLTAVAALVGLAGLVAPAFVSFAPATSTTTAKAGIETLAWSPETVSTELAKGRAVFVDFTADWCVSCKANERVALARDDVRQVFADTDTAFLIADWTNKNDEIARELAAYGRAGVPLYLLYPAGSHDGVSPRILPQILTPGLVKDALLEANSP